MSRSRNIKPGFFKNEELAELPFEYRILFQGLWCEADREGRLEDRPKRLKAELFPYDNVDVDHGLTMLACKGFITRYVIDGVGYLQVDGFKKHQNPHLKETPSTIPAPDKKVSAPEIPVQAPEFPERAVLIPDSLNLIPDSLETTLADSPPVAESEKPKAEKPAKVPEFSESFTAFWLAYPKRRREKKAESFKVWKAEKLDGCLLSILAHVKAQSKSHDWQREGGQFVPQPPAYLRGKRWLDEVGDAAPAERGPVGASPVVVKTAAQEEAERITGLKHMAALGNQDAKEKLHQLGIAA